MNNKLFPIGAVIAAILASGCATTPPSDPPSASIDSKFVTGTLKAMCDAPADCKTFELALSNRTDETVEIDWNRSYYLNNGRPDGGLYFDGIIVAQRNNPKSPDIILPKSSFKRTLVPNNSFSLAMFPLAHWDVKAFNGSTHGVYLALKSGGKEDVVNTSVTLKAK